MKLIEFLIVIKPLDFSTEVFDAKGEVEITTNILGKEIKKMLVASSILLKI